jgi:hypothetical protein
MHVVGHAGPGLHTYGVHVAVVPTLHAPAPLQTWVTLSVVELAHWPSMHSLSGSALFATNPHVPSPPEPFLTAEHAWHEPVQALLQQTPSTQLPLTHSLLPRHEAPSPFFGTHDVITQ